jgi:hypothetical protein
MFLLISTDGKSYKCLDPLLTLTQNKLERLSVENISGYGEELIHKVNH